MLYLLDGEETARLRFRKIRDTDFKDWLPFFEHPETHLHWKQERLAPELECTLWYEKQQGRYEQHLGGMNALVEKSNGLLVGHCGLIVQEVDGKRELEIAYSLLPAFWNRGYATEAAAACRDRAFMENWATSLISIISITNQPSIRVALKTGLCLDTTTTYRDNDVYIYRILQTRVTTV